MMKQTSEQEDCGEYKTEHQGWVKRTTEEWGRTKPMRDQHGHQNGAWTSGGQNQFLKIVKHITVTF